VLYFGLLDHHCDCRLTTPDSARLVGITKVRRATGDSFVRAPAVCRHRPINLVGRGELSPLVSDNSGMAWPKIDGALVASPGGAVMKRWSGPPIDPDALRSLLIALVTIALVALAIWEFAR
jgi:hypothetical protein